jgi:hypothetical protein
MPWPLDPAQVRFDNPRSFAKRASIAGHPNFWIQPEFRFQAVFFDVDM